MGLKHSKHSSITSPTRSTTLTDSSETAGSRRSSLRFDPRARINRSSDGPRSSTETAQQQQQQQQHRRNSSSFLRRFKEGTSRMSRSNTNDSTTTTDSSSAGRSNRSDTFPMMTSNGSTAVDNAVSAAVASYSGRETLSSSSGGSTKRSNKPCCSEWDITTLKEAQHRINNVNDEDCPTGDCHVSPRYLSECLLMEKYLLPEHEPWRKKEKDRQQRQHYMLNYVFRQAYEFHTKSPTLIINWCCGAGYWAMEVAQRYPKCRIVGIDYSSATLPNLQQCTKNLYFEHTIVHEGHTGLESFEDNVADHVMMRDVWLVNSPEHKWLDVLRQVHRVLKPGGCIEIYEQDLAMKSPGSYLFLVDQWAGTIFSRVGIDRDTSKRISKYLGEVGFVDIDERVVELPLGEWSSIQAMKETGYLFKDLMKRKFDTFKDWMCDLNNLDESQVTVAIKTAMSECEEAKTCMNWRYFTARKQN